MTIFKELNYIFNKKQKIRLCILFFVMLIGTVLELIGVTAVLPLVEAMTNPNSIMEKKYFSIFYNFFGFKNTEEFMIVICIIIIAVYLFKNIYVMLQNDLQYRFVYNNQVRLSDKLMNAYMKQPYLFHTAHNSAELIRNVLNDTQTFFRAVLAALQLLTDASVCIVLFIFLLLTDAMITMALIVLFACFMFFYMKIFKRKLKELGCKTRESNEEMTKYSLQAFGGIKEIQILNRESYFLNKFHHSCGKFATSQRKYNLMLALPKPMMEFLCVGGLLGVIAVRLSMGVNMESFVAVLSTFAIAAFRMLPSINKLTANLGIIVFSKPSVDAIYKDLKAVERVIYDSEQAQKNEEGHTTEKIHLKKEIAICNLGFSYPGNDREVLSNISFSIPKNKAIAFVGPSGQGKTTLADIILGVIAPTKGCIEVDGINIHEHLEAWHQGLGYIPQNIYLTDDSLRHNIAFGIEDEKIDEKRILKALEMAQLKSFVESLPEGIDTYVGEGGMRLSGGQRQRIGIARALYSDPEVLVLDEATSALDNDTEAAVMEAVEQLSGSITMIIIAHRLSTIENCDYVYQINEGKVELVKEKKL